MPCSKSHKNSHYNHHNRHHHHNNQLHGDHTTENHNQVDDKENQNFKGYHNQMENNKENQDHNCHCKDHNHKPENQPNHNQTHKNHNQNHSTRHHHHNTHHQRPVRYMDANAKDILGGHYNITAINKIGQGYTSTVTRCSYKPNGWDGDSRNERILAVKAMPKEKVSRSFAIREIELLRKCQDKHVLRYETALECRDHYIVITEFCGKGDMYTNLKNINSINLLKDYMSGIVRGVEALHTRLVAHCDIKMKNILITENDVVKLADFGFAVQLESPDGLIHQLNGTRDYWAPEMWRYNAHFNPLTADIYALAVTFVGMCERRAVKRKNDNIHQIVHNYKDIQQRRMIQGMLEMYPEDRWTLEQIKNSEWLNDGSPPPSPS